ncbi:tetratricopeptide repeat protein [Myroides albus]|uniref:tetratricopeptide repeat protein n=1 Tax=Myroides albus TaxID=2562892 RepID=UPI002158BC6F|nr:tetratricopeptide repeat protein [Myroides albus]UVD79344.1 tetratricopeptide repeat protein [Myroides albus]
MLLNTKKRLTALCFFSMMSLYAQESIMTVKAKAGDLFNQERYQEALPLFQDLLVRTKSKDYNFEIARVYAKLGDKEKAMLYLNAYTSAKAVDAKLIEFIEFIPDFESLHQLDEWKLFVQNLKEQDIKKNSPYASIISQLETIFDRDQSIRKQYNQTQSIHGNYSNELKAVSDEMKKIDQANLQEVEAILVKHGWLGADQIGYKANKTLFLVIQHADLTVQQKYQTMIADALKKGKVDAKDYATMADRIAMYEGRKQIYGTQVVSIEKGEILLWPIEDIGKINELRKQMGITQTIEEYMSTMLGQEWNIDTYKEQLPQILKHLNIK